MRTLFLLNPTAGKADCTRTLPQQINAAAARAGLAPEEYAIQVTNHAGHARELANAAAQQARQSGEELRVFTAGGDGTFNEALTGIYGYANAAVGCLPFGSGNDFLRTYGTREEFNDLDAQLAGGEVDIDLMQTDLGLSATICAAGLDAQVAYGIPQFRRIPFCGGEMAYALSIVKQLCGHIGRNVTFTIDGEGADGGLPDVCHLQWPHLWRRLLCSAGSTARRWLAGCIYHPQGEPRDHCKAAGNVQERQALPERSARQGCRAVLHLPPRKTGEPARCGWPRADRCHGRR